MLGGYRMATGDGGKRYRVVQHHGFDGYWLRWTQACSGCSDSGEMTSESERGSGCADCGYTGKARHVFFRPLDEVAFQAWVDAEWAKSQSHGEAL